MFDVLKRLPEFSWDAYKEALLKEGIVLKTKESDGKVVNYKVHYEGRKSEYNAEEWARKCARQAVKMCKPQMVKHAIAKPKYRRR